MRKFITFALTILLVTPIISFAQNCNGVEKSKDAFSGEVVKKAEIIIGTLQSRWQINLLQKGAKYYIGVNVVSGGDVRSKIMKGEKLMIKLENEKIIELEMDRDYPPGVTVSGTSIYTIWTTNTEVEEKVMRRLGRSPMTDIKATINGADFVLPKIKKGQANSVMDAAACRADLDKETK